MSMLVFYFKENSEYERAHRSHGYGVNNEVGDTILDLITSYDLIIANTCFGKREQHLIFFKSGSNNSQTDFFFTRKYI